MRWKEEHMKIGVSAAKKHTGHSRSFIFSSIDLEMKSTKVSLTILLFFLNSKSVLYNSSLSVVFLSFLFCRQSIFFVKLPFSISFFDLVITQVNELVLRSFLISSISFLISFALL